MALIRKEKEKSYGKKNLRSVRQGTPLYHFWSSCIGAGRAAEGLRADWQKQLARTVADGTPMTRGRSRCLQSTLMDLTWIRDLVKNSAFPDIEIHLTEWSSSPSSRDYAHDFLPEAAYIIKCNTDCIGLAHSLSYWVFTDIFEEEGPAPEAFHGGFGLQTIHGIPKPSYHAYCMLHQLGNTLLEKGEDYSAAFSRSTPLP